MHIFNFKSRKIFYTNKKEYDRICLTDKNSYLTKEYHEQKMEKLVHNSCFTTKKIENVSLPSPSICTGI